MQNYHFYDIVPFAEEEIRANDGRSIPVDGYENALVGAVIGLFKQDAIEQYPVKIANDEDAIEIKDCE